MDLTSIVSDFRYKEKLNFKISCGIYCFFDKKGFLGSVLCNIAVLKWRKALVL